MKAEGANMGMSLKQPLILMALMALTLVGFQNCAKVGVDDLGSSDPVAMGNAINPPSDEGDAGTLPDSDESEPDDIEKNPPKMPPIADDQPPKKDCDKDDDEDRKNPPVVKEACLPMNQVRIKESKESCDKDGKPEQKVSQKQELQTVACLSNPGESCVLICHKPPGNPSNSHNLMMKSSGSVQAHLAHGDSLGACAETPGTLPSDVIVCEAKDEDHHGHDYENPHDPKTKR
ncbi:MAG: hypothetical protein ACXWC9_02970 [Pseudobdellovibrionaceae bacterium]